MESLLIAVALSAVVASARPVVAADGSVFIRPETENELRDTYRRLIDAENAHDIDAVRRLSWKSPTMLLWPRPRRPQRAIGQAFRVPRMS
jgi:hypothetical protein